MTSFGVERLRSESHERTAREDIFVRIGAAPAAYQIGRLHLHPDREILTFGEEAERRLRSCFRFYLPPLLLAGRDLKAKYHRASLYRTDLSSERLQNDYLKGINYYLTPEMQQPCFLAQISSESSDIELRPGSHVWVVGYYDGERSFWDGARALVINSENFLDSIEPRLLNVPEAVLQTKFPTTPLHYGPITELPKDFCPTSLK